MTAPANDDLTAIKAMLVDALQDARTENDFDAEFYNGDSDYFAAPANTMLCDTSRVIDLATENTNLSLRIAELEKENADLIASYPDGCRVSAGWAADIVSSAQDDITARTPFWEWDDQTRVDFAERLNDGFCEVYLGDNPRQLAATVPAAPLLDRIADLEDQLYTAIQPGIGYRVDTRPVWIGDGTEPWVPLCPECLSSAYDEETGSCICRNEELVNRLTTLADQADRGDVVTLTGMTDEEMMESLFGDRSAEPPALAATTFNMKMMAAGVEEVTDPAKWPEPIYPEFKIEPIIDPMWSDAPEPSQEDVHRVIGTINLVSGNESGEAFVLNLDRVHTIPEENLAEHLAFLAKDADEADRGDNV